MLPGIINPSAALSFTSFVPSDTLKENWSACFSSSLVWTYWMLRDARSACVKVLILVPKDVKKDFSDELVCSCSHYVCYFILHILVWDGFTLLEKIKVTCDHHSITQSWLYLAACALGEEEPCESISPALVQSNVTAGEETPPPPQLLFLCRRWCRAAHSRCITSMFLQDGTTMQAITTKFVPPSVWRRHQGHEESWTGALEGINQQQNGYVLLWASRDWWPPAGHSWSCFWLSESDRMRHQVPMCFSRNCTQISILQLNWHSPESSRTAPVLYTDVSGTITSTMASPVRTCSDLNGNQFVWQNQETSETNSTALFLSFKAVG